MVPSLRELIALTLLAGLGCGLALAHGDLLFVAVFGGAIAAPRPAAKQNDGPGLATTHCRGAS